MISTDSLRKLQLATCSGDWLPVLRIACAYRATSVYWAMMEALLTGKVQAKGERMGPIGMPEMIGIFMIALLLFGPKKLPELGRTLGKALTEFRRAKNELKSTFETHMQELERETKLETPQKEFTPASYSYPYDEYGRYEEPVSSTETHHPAEPSHLVENNYHSDSTVTAEPHVTPAPAVPGTVARTNGIQPTTAIAKEEHHT